MDELLRAKNLLREGGQSLNSIFADCFSNWFNSIPWKDFRIGPPKISHFATLEWLKTMLEAKKRLNFDAEMQ